MTHEQATRLEALTQLLAHGDLFDGRRGSRVTQPGDPERFARLAQQPTVYQQHALVARENGEPLR